MTAEPIRNERKDCGRLSSSSWWTTAMPIQRANAILPITAARSSAQSTNGMTAIPTTDTASSTHTGPASNMTSRPVMNVDSGVARKVVVAARTGASNMKFRSRLMRKKTSATVQTHPSHGTIGRASSSPCVSHGTMPRSRAPRPAVPMTTWWPSGLNPGALSRPPTTNRSSRTCAPSATTAVPPITTNDPSMTAVLASSTLPSTTTTSRSTRPSMIASPAITTTSRATSLVLSVKFCPTRMVGLPAHLLEAALEFLRGGRRRDARRDGDRKHRQLQYLHDCSALSTKT